MTTLSALAALTPSSSTTARKLWSSSRYDCTEIDPVRTRCANRWIWDEQGAGVQRRELELAVTS